MDRRPTLTVVWSSSPDAPADLRPGRGTFVSTRKPVLAWSFGDVRDASAFQTAYRVEVDDLETFAAPDFDSGQIASGTSQVDLNATAYAGLPTDGAVRYWRSRVWDDSGAISAVSDPVSTRYAPLGVVAITAPAATTPDVRPEVVWTFTPPAAPAGFGAVVQEAYRAKIERLDGTVWTVLADSGLTTGTVLSWSPPIALSDLAATYRATVEVADSLDRESLPTAPALARASRTFTIAPSGSVGRSDRPNRDGPQRLRGPPRLVARDAAGPLVARGRREDPRGRDRRRADRDVLRLDLLRRPPAEGDDPRASRGRADRRRLRPLGRRLGLRHDLAGRDLARRSGDRTSDPPSRPRAALGRDRGDLGGLPSPGRARAGRRYRTGPRIRGERGRRPGRLGRTERADREGDRDRPPRSRRGPPPGPRRSESPGRDLRPHRESDTAAGRSGFRYRFRLRPDRRIRPMRLPEETTAVALADVLEATERFVSARATILDRNEKPLGSSLPILSGSVSVDAGAAVTRSAEVHAIDPNRALGFDAGSPGNGALYADRFLQLEYGVADASRVLHWTPIFRGPVVRFDRSHPEIDDRGPG